MAWCWAGVPVTVGQGSVVVGVGVASPSLQSLWAAAGMACGGGGGVGVLGWVEGGGGAVAVGVPGGGGAVADVELHRAGAAAEGVDARGDAGGAGAAVVGFDLADPGQQLPGQRRAGVGGLEVQGQVPRGDIRQRKRTRLDGRARRDAGRGGRARPHDPGDGAAHGGGADRDREARRGHAAEQRQDEQHGDHSPAGQLDARAHGTDHPPLASRRTVTSAVSRLPLPRSARTRTRTSRLETLSCWSGRTWLAPRCSRAAYQAAAASAGLDGRTGRAAGGAARSGVPGVGRVAPVSRGGCAGRAEGPAEAEGAEGTAAEGAAEAACRVRPSAAGLSPCWYSSTTAAPSATATTASRWSRRASSPRRAASTSPGARPRLLRTARRRPPGRPAAAGPAFPGRGSSPAVRRPRPGRGWPVGLVKRPRWSRSWWRRGWLMPHLHGPRWGA